MAFSINELREMSASVRALSVDQVQTAKSGHPGAPLGMADVATVLFANHLRFDPKHPNWPNRDRFILSAGHASAMLYSILYLTGYDITIDDLKSFRKLGSRTQGHPECGAMPGIEMSTGPLGQGIATSVGIALAEKIKRDRGDADSNWYTYVMASDGDLMEGLSAEAISLAGFHKLNHLIVLWDNNEISIDGDTKLTRSDDILGRFESANWDTISVNGLDSKSVDAALTRAKKNKRPTLIACKTTIGYLSVRAGDAATHGSPLSDDDAKNVMKKLGCEKPFMVSAVAKKLWAKTGTRGAAGKTTKFSDTELKKLCKSAAHELIKSGKPIATRAASGIVLDHLMEMFGDEIIGGSADLTPSVNTFTKFSSDIMPDDASGNYIHYGVREHAMAAIMNGLTLSGFRAYGGTFLIFSDYMRPSMRLSSLMKLPVIYVLTHDSIALGEDGATHQPVEHLTSFRAMPNMNVFRPCDAVEVSECWELALSNNETPSILSLTRQSLPIVRTDISENKSSYGGYILSEAVGGSKKRDVTLLATGSEVSLALNVQKILAAKKINSAIVSMPCVELFEKQTEKYRDSVLCPESSFVLAIEAGATLSWYKYADAIMGIDEFGESGAGADVYRAHGFDAEFIAKELISILKKA